jgi:methionyl aminopeptidase
VSVESEADLAGLQRAGRVVALALAAMRDAVPPGLTTAELDAIGAAVFRRHGARSAPQLAYGFPGVNCISLDDEAVHGTPSPARRIAAGDLVTLDVTAELDGYVADAATTVEAGSGTAAGRRLIRTAAAALGRGLRAGRGGRPISAIGAAVEREVTRRGFAVVPALGGHGVGRAIHEPPWVPNVDDPRHDAPLTDGLVLTVEPVVGAGGRVVERGDGWTVATLDGSRCAHVEHTIVVRRGRPLVLTRLPPASRFVTEFA